MVTFTIGRLTSDGFTIFFVAGFRAAFGAATIFLLDLIAFFTGLVLTGAKVNSPQRHCEEAAGRRSNPALSRRRLLRRFAARNDNMI
jgi:hypothetical protein